MTARTLLAAVALTAGLVAPVAVAPSASALSCVAPDEVLERATVVYAGKVVDFRDDRALVAVEEVWRGGPVEEQVWLRVELQEWMSWADREGKIPEGYRTKESWLFAPHAGRIGPCSSWKMGSWLEEYVEDHRPAQPEAPVAAEATPPTGGDAGQAAAEEPEQESSTSWPLVGGLAGLLAVIGAGALLLGRRRARA